MPESLKKIFGRTSEEVLLNEITEYVVSLSPEQIANILVNYGPNGKLFEICNLMAKLDNEFFVLSLTEKPEVLRKKLFYFFNVREHLRRKDRLIECISNLFL